MEIIKWLFYWWIYITHEKCWNEGDDIMFDHYWESEDLDFSYFLGTYCLCNLYQVCKQLPPKTVCWYLWILVISSDPKLSRQTLLLHLAVQHSCFWAIQSVPVNQVMSTWVRIEYKRRPLQGVSHLVWFKGSKTKIRPRTVQ